MSKVYVSVGHGRKSNGVMDPGATTTDGSKSEQSEGSPIARACASRLRDLGVNVNLNDTGGPDFFGASHEANQWGADIAVEVHHDWNGAPRGCFGYWWPGSEQGQRLANAIRDRVVGTLGYPHRPDYHTSRNLAWVRRTAMPAVLWECDRIGEVDDHAAYGRAMADGIATHLGIDPGEGSDSEPDSGDSEAPEWPGVYLSQPPVRHTQACQTWQQRMRERGWVQSDGRAVKADGWYGPESERVCRLFQGEKHLKVDGVVGPKTWRASWVAPVT